MSFLGKVSKVFSSVKAFFSRRRTGPTLEPSQTSITAAHNPITATETLQPSAVFSPAKAPSDVDGHALSADDGSDSVFARGFAAFKSALEVTKEFADPFPPLKYAVAALLIAMEGFENVTEVQEDFAYVARKLNFMRTTYDEHRSQLEASESTKASMDSLARAMQIVAKMVKAKSDRGLFRRIWENPSDVKAVADALRMLGDVVDQFVISITVSTHSMVLEANQNQALDQLEFVKSAQFLSIENGRPCTEGTRAEFLADLLAWAMAADKPSICWVNGAAGSGKTTITYTLCSFLRGLGLLGGSFFCSRDADDKRRSTKFIFSTLARSLAYHDGAYARSLAEVLKEPGAGSVAASEQLASLITAPFCSSGHSSLAPIRILVIDALDECGDDDKTIYDIIRRLLTETRGLRLKFLITSRPEPHIIRAFNNDQQGSFLVRRVQDIPDSVAKIDIMTYLESELKECARSRGISDEWPPASQVQDLALQAGTLFIYASTACKYIWNFDEDPVEQLATLTAVDAEPLRGIDPMYEFVLEQVRRSKNDHTWAITRRCVQAIIRLSHPLSISDLADLLGLDKRVVRTSLIGLQSVLRIPSSDTSDTINVFHASFPDYFLNENRSRGKDWFLESAAVHGDLLQRCITIMKSHLCFNISNSRTSYLSNDKQPVKPTLSGALRYSCLHWIDHLEGHGNLVVSELAELSELLMERFLYWLEVLSVAGEVPRGRIAMTRLVDWLYAHPAPSGASDKLCQISEREMAQTTSQHGLRQFARDARDFVNRFARPIEDSCPHIYLSALAFTAKSSSIWAKMLTMFKELPSIITQQAQDVCPIFISGGHEGFVKSVAFSPDGTRIVSGSQDHTIRLWDAATGAAIGDPLSGHEDTIMSVAFSSDRMYVVSGSSDYTIRLWLVATGVAVGNPLRGHEDLVKSVAFSPDGLRIVSGACDSTIRLWDTATGAAVGDPLRIHKGSILSVAFSPDGTHVVSGSDDRMIRLWDAATGTVIGEALHGHEDYVNSVAYSPDGARIVSGSSDHTIRFWDAATGAAIGEPIRGHQYDINSVAFSPDGTLVVSGSWDCTIRLWDAATGAAIGGPLGGHENWVGSVAFSPDGLRVVSGSFDHTIRLWDVASGAAIDDPFRGHLGLISSFAFSLDGTRIVSGSRGGSIQLWDAATGAAIGDPFRAHEHWVRCVAFSPDGTRVVSGSDDRTVRLWDVATGAAIGDPLFGHEGGVWSVAFSPDGARIVSGSSDHIIRLWDAVAVAAIGEPFRGQTHLVYSVVFSPDGTRVVSGFGERTVHLWDGGTGVAIGEPVHSYADVVLSFAFSPDATRVISGSYDNTIGLWDAATGAAIGGPFRGHEHWVSCVAFSPDGTRIVSGSHDHTVRLWDAATGAAIGEPLRGHERSVQSVAFSPEGTRIVSGADDRTIRLWDVATGAAVGDAIVGHDAVILSVAFSLDGTHVFSVSLDYTIRRWDTNFSVTIDDVMREVDHPSIASADDRDQGATSVLSLAHAAHPVLTSDRLCRVAFSPNNAHATHIGTLLPPQLRGDPRDAFTMDPDGWLRGPNGELFLWILPEYRLGLWWPRTTAVMGTYPVMLDLSRFVHGENWIKCLQQN